MGKTTAKKDVKRKTAAEKAKAREDLLNDLNSDNSDIEEIDDDDDDAGKKSENEADVIMEESKAADVSKLSDEIVMMSDNDGDHEDMSDEDLSPKKKAKSKAS